MAADSSNYGGARQYDRRGGGPTNSRITEYLMIGALVLIIGGSLTFTIWRFVGGPHKPKLPNLPPEKYQCLKCGGEFMPDMSKNQGFGMEDEVMGLDCPKCGGKHTAQKMTLCPKCGTYYMAESTRLMAEALQQKTPQLPDRMPRFICPKCGTDRDEYLIEQAKSRKKD